VPEAKQRSLKTTCPNCGEKFEPKSARHIACSRKCSRKIRGRVIKQCAYRKCANAFVKNKYPAKKHYCSIECSYKEKWLRRKHKRQRQRREERGRVNCANPKCSESWIQADFREDKRLCSKRCSDAVNPLRNERHNRNQKKFRSAVLGRVCVYCERKDKDYRFQTMNICIRCYRTQDRNPRCEMCGGPTFKYPSQEGAQGCIVKRRLPPGVSCRGEVGDRGRENKNGR